MDTAVLAVGTITSQLIRENLGLPACGHCHDIVKDMNDKGPDWCEANKKELAARMLENSKKMRQALKDGDESLQLTDEEKKRLQNMRFIPTPVQLYGAVRIINEAIRLARDQGV